MKTKTLQELVLTELADMYAAQHRRAKALLKKIGTATREELSEAFRSHIEETHRHTKRLERTYAAFAAKTRARQWEALLDLADGSETSESESRINGALIPPGGNAERYEIVCFGDLRARAVVLDNQRAADLVAEILARENSAGQNQRANRPRNFPRGNRPSLKRGNRLPARANNGCSIKFNQ